jgi:hypothetical protein
MPDRLAVTPVGAPGRLGVVTLLEVVVKGLVPTALDALTSNVYDVPGVSPVSTRDVAGVPVAVSKAPGGEDTTL